MPRTCTVCRSEARAEVDRALVHGEPYRVIAGRWSLASAVERHRHHVAAPVLAAWEQDEATLFSDLAAYVGELEASARRILERAAASGNGRLELAALAANRAHIELMVKLVHAARG